MTLEQRCPRCGDISTSADLCSECGAPMAGAPPAVPLPQAAPPPVPAALPGSGPQTCPVCGEARPGPQARFCDNCRYDFRDAKPFGAAPPPVAAALPPAPGPEAAVPQSADPDATEVAAQVPQAIPAPASTIVQPAAAAPAPAHVPSAVPIGGAVRWEVVAAADPSLCQPGDPQPSDLRERVFPLDFPENLIGRRSDSQGVHPEIVIADPGVSKRHARICRKPDGTLELLDLGSTNGTRLNGASVDANVPYPVRDGDEIVLGAFTRLKIRGC
jgi:hypothetical protein